MVEVVIGVDEHRRSHTLVAVDEVGRKVGERTAAAASEGHLAALEWAPRWSAARFALEDCRHVTRREGELLAAGCAVVRVPTQLIATAWRAGREPGTPDPIDALAVAGACAPIGYVVIKLDRGVYFLIVDLTDPTRAVSATLDGPVLAVLAQAGKPLTAGEVAGMTPRGSEIGVRRSLARLVEQGIVRATEMGRNRVHELNREHVATPVADALAGLRLALWARFRATLSGWNPRPVYGCVFGSAARGDGDAHSDIDVLLVRTPVAGESDPRRKSAGLAESLAGYASELVAVQLTERQAAKWDRQVGDLHDLVRGWTGNRLQVVEMSAYQWADHRRRRTPLFEDISRDAIQVAGETSWAGPARTGAR